MREWWCSRKERGGRRERTGTCAAAMGWEGIRRRTIDNRDSVCEDDKRDERWNDRCEPIEFLFVVHIEMVCLDRELDRDICQNHWTPTSRGIDNIDIDKDEQTTKRRARIVCWLDHFGSLALPRPRTKRKAARRTSSLEPWPLDWRTGGRWTTAGDDLSLFNSRRDKWNEDVVNDEEEMLLSLSLSLRWSVQLFSSFHCRQLIFNSSSLFFAFVLTIRCWTRTRMSFLSFPFPRLTSKWRDSIFFQIYFTPSTKRLWIWFE